MAKIIETIAIFFGVNVAVLAWWWLVALATAAIRMSKLFP